MLRPKAFNITQIPPYQFAYRLRLALPQIKGSDIQCRLLTKSNLAVVDCYTEQAAHLLLNLEHLIIDDQIVQFKTYVALREGRIRGVIHRIKGLTEEQLMQGLTSSTHEIVSARPLGMSNTALITFNGTGKKKRKEKTFEAQSSAEQVGTAWSEGRWCRAAAVSGSGPEREKSDMPRTLQLVTEYPEVRGFTEFRP
ncbi:hypothetical protein MTO96_037003 [Rhipicephalus appendiculatus]